jgi:hypothetical protein
LVRGQSAAWWSVEINYEMPGEQPCAEHRMVRAGSDVPERAIDDVIEPTS